MSNAPRTRSTTSLDEHEASKVSNENLSSAIRSEMNSYFKSEGFKSLIFSIMEKVLNETITVTLDNHAAKIASLEGDMAAITSHNTELSNALNNLTAKNSELEVKLEALHSQNDKLEGSFTNLQGHL